MTVSDRSTSPVSLLGGAIDLSGNPCEHGPARSVDPWMGDTGTSGTVTVVGAGKMGLPLAAQFASHGWHVIAVDIDESVVAAINEGRAHVDEEPGLADRVAEVHAAGMLRATTDGTAAARESDVIVLIVPVMLDDERRPDYRYMDSAARSVAPGVRAGATVIFETTLPVGDTRNRYVPVLEEASGLHADEDFFVAFSPERLFTGAVFKNLATYPKLVGGVGQASTDRAGSFYASVLDAEVVKMSSSEAAELSKLADTTYRDVNIAYANQLAAYADSVGVDVQEVIATANSQPYSHIHQPGLGVGGHCIPVYPHFLLSRDPAFTLIEESRRVNDGQVDVAIAALDGALGGLEDVAVLVLGLTYREGVKELAYSRALPLVDGLLARGARVSAWDPLLSAGETRSWADVTAWDWGSPSPARAIVVQTADPVFRDLDADWFPEAEVLIDGRNALREVRFPDRLRVLGMGVPARGQRTATTQTPR